MAPGDLNLKKSWNPKLMKNQKKVWEREQEALQERKKIKERQKEIELEREKQELRRLRGGKDSIDRIEWMYAQSKDEDQGDKDEKEDFLVGKKKLDELILQKNEKVKSKGVRNDKLNKALNFDKKQLSDAEKKRIARDDPMAKIKMMQRKKLVGKKL